MIEELFPLQFNFLILFSISSSSFILFYLQKITTSTIEDYERESEKKWIWDKLSSLEPRIFDLSFLTLLRRHWFAVAGTSPAPFKIVFMHLNPQSPLVPLTSNTAAWNCTKPLIVQIFLLLSFFFLLTKLFLLFQKF